MKNEKKYIALIFVLLLVSVSRLSYSQEVKILDSHHYSHVFGEIRNYRVFLPRGYDRDLQKRYPVIYFFHGWSERYFGIAIENPYDKGDDNNGDNVEKFVSKNDVIVIKWDGFDIKPGEDYTLSPYNVSSSKTHRQFPLYFPELVKHIDSNFRTIPDRNNRGVSGLSMGGFMAFFVGGKYPHLVCAAGSFCGSPEYMIGANEFRSHYRHTEMYNNYGGMRVRLNNGNRDTLRSYHFDMNKIWLQVMDNYVYKMYETGHVTCGLGEMFGFLTETFKNPPPKPDRWHHTDIYPNFSVWDYEVESDRFTPGLTILENVDKRGFRCSVREFLPCGEFVPYVKLNITTAPIYEKNTEYVINDINLTVNETARFIIRSDAQGRLKIQLNGYMHEIGINERDDRANVTLADFEIENMNWAVPLKNVELPVNLLNKGAERANGVTAEIKAIRNYIEIIKNRIEFGSINKNEIKKSKNSFVFRVNDSSIEIVRFQLVIRDNENNEWSEFFEVPVRVDYPEITEFKIADGREVTVADAGTLRTSIVLGTGNGDGIANPGESIVILVKDEIKISYKKSEFSAGVESYIRTFSHANDKYVNPNGIYLREKEEWHRFDSVGGSAKITMPVIASDCPGNRSIPFFVEYWIPNPDNNRCHDVKRGIVNIKVSGEDKTAPMIRWARITGDNTLYAKVQDGGDISYVKAELIPSSEKIQYLELSGQTMNLTLLDNGLRGDRIKGDNVFTVKIPEEKFRLYNIKIDASDSHGNKTSRTFHDIFTVH